MRLHWVILLIHLPLLSQNDLLITPAQHRPSPWQLPVALPAEVFGHPLYHRISQHLYIYDATFFVIYDK